MGMKEEFFNLGELPVRVLNAKGNIHTDFLHYHDCLEINYVLSGSGVNYIDHRKYEMKKGDIYLINPMEHHFAAVQTALEMKIIIFKAEYIWQHTSDNEPFIQPFYQKSVMWGSRICLDEISERQAAQLIHTIEEEISKQAPGYTLFVKSALMMLLAIIYRYTNSEEVKTEGLRQQGAYEKIRPSVEYIQNHPEAELSLDILAELSCMSKNYFCTCFKKTMQMTVGEYTELVRINRAAILAETTDLPVTEICYQCGYGNITSFNAAFKKLTGMTAGAYRKNRKIPAI